MVYIIDMTATIDVIEIRCIIDMTAMLYMIDMIHLLVTRVLRHALVIAGPTCDRARPWTDHGFACVASCGSSARVRLSSRP